METRPISSRQDHNLQNELLKRGKLTPDQISQVKQKNALTRAIGVYSNVEVDTLDFGVVVGIACSCARTGSTSYLRKGELNWFSRTVPEQAAQALVSLAKSSAVGRTTLRPW